MEYAHLKCGRPCLPCTLVAPYIYKSSYRTYKQTIISKLICRLLCNTGDRGSDLTICRNLISEVARRLCKNYKIRKGADFSVPTYSLPGTVDYLMKQNDFLTNNDRNSLGVLADKIMDIMIFGVSSK